MSVVGNQHFRAMGSRFVFRRDATSSTNYPWVDLGVIDPISPTVESERIVVEDSSSGLAVEVDEAITRINESYEFLVKNLSMRTLSMFFLSEPESAASQSAAAASGSQRLFVGEIGQVVDSSDDPLFMLSAIAGFATGSVTTGVVTDIDVSTRTVTLSAAVSLTKGDLVIIAVDGLAGIDNAGTYTVSATVSSSTTFVVDETMGAADETSITGLCVMPGSGTILAGPDQSAPDWQVASLNRGAFEIPSASTANDDTLYTCYYGTSAITGNRVIQPQSISGLLKGDGVLFQGADNNGEILARYGRFSLAPNGASWGIDDFSSVTFTGRVLSNLTATVPAGTLTQIKGTLPSIVAS